MTYLLGNVYNINLPRSVMLLTNAGKKKIIISHELED